MAKPLSLQIAVAIEDGHASGARIRPFDATPHRHFRAVLAGHRVAAPPGEPQLSWIATTWEEVIRSAVCVGRPLTSTYLDTFGNQATAEVNTRLGALVTTVRPAPLTAGGERIMTLRPARLPYFIDRTDSGGIHYRLGMTMADWFGDARLGIHESMHLGAVPSPHRLWPFIQTSIRKPDLLLEDPGGATFVLEAKARRDRNAVRRGRNDGAEQLWSFRNQGGVPAHHQILVTTRVPTDPDPFIQVLVDADGRLTPPVPAAPPKAGVATWLREWALLLRRFLLFRSLTYGYPTVDAALAGADSGVRIEIGPRGTPVVVRRFRAFGVSLGMTYAAARLVEAQSEVLGGDLEYLNTFVTARASVSVTHEAMLAGLADAGDEPQDGFAPDERYLRGLEPRPEIVVDASGIAVLLEERANYFVG